MALIELSNIRKSYHDGEKRVNRILRNIDLSIEKSEFVAVRGHSGAGKTTLLSILGTLLQPDSGTYLLDGRELTQPKTDYSAIRNRYIGFVFQDHRLLPQFTALENILLPLLAERTVTTTDDVAYARHLMTLTRIEGVEQQYPHTLSGGEASRVAVCRALMMKPLLLLADEPTGQLDSENAHHIAQLLSDINRQLQTTIVMVTHDDDVAAAAARTLTLKEGILQ
jgi:ABC-type lipoprotein export system ATPase subunit